MTERKEPGLTFESWVDKQIRQAQEQGAFDDLDGTGRPIAAGDPGDELWWVRGYLQRENLPLDALLPTPLQLRKEIERLPATLLPLSREESVRQILDELNTRIVDWIRFPTPPIVPLGPVDVELWVQRWQIGRAEIERVDTRRGEVADRTTSRSVGNDRSWWDRLRGYLRSSR